MRHVDARTRLAVCGLALAAGAAAAVSQPVREKIEASIMRPEGVEPTEERVAQLSLPAGFRIEKFADGLGHARMLAAGPDGSLFLTRPKQGDVLRLMDEDGDGRAERVETAASSLAGVHGICFDGDRCYLATVTEIYECPVRPDGSLGEARMRVDDLPDGGQHPNRTLGVGPDGMLYVSVGSTCNACEETNPEHATILRFDPRTGARSIFAHGLRNTIGFGWHPETGEMWGMDHGMDWLGDDENREELNKLELGKHYGWPYVYEDGKLNPVREPQGASYEEIAASTVGPALTYTAHAAPIQMAFCTGGAFPEEYDGDAFVVMRGSWNRSEPSGYEVVRIGFREGRPEGIEPFVSGFLVDGGRAHMGRLAGAAVGGDGALYVSDDTNGVVYRISYEGER